MRVFVLVLKDLRRTWRDRQALLTNIALPLLLTAVMGFAFGGSGGSGISAIPLAIVAEDVPTILRDWIDEQLSATDLFATTWLDSTRADRKVRRGEVAAAVIFPNNLLRDYMTGRNVRIALWKDPNSEIKAGIIEQVLTRVFRRIQVDEAASRVLWPQDYDFDPEPMEKLFSLVESGDLLAAWRYVSRDDRADDWEQTRLDAERIMDHQMKLEEIRKSGGVQLVLDDSGKQAETAEAVASQNRFDYFLPGFAVFFLLFSVAASMKDLQRERRVRTLQRTMLTPAGSNEILFAKWSGATLAGTMQVMLVFVIAAIVFRVNLGPDPWSLLTVTLVASASATSVFLALSVICRSEKQLDQISTILILYMAILGGSFIPADGMPPFMQMIGKSTFTWWANTAYAEVVTRDNGLRAVTLNILIMGGLGVILTSISLAIWRLRHREGAAV